MKLHKTLHYLSILATEERLKELELSVLYHKQELQLQRMLTHVHTGRVLIKKMTAVISIAQAEASQRDQTGRFPDKPILQSEVFIKLSSTTILGNHHVKSSIRAQLPKRTKRLRLQSVLQSILTICLGTEVSSLQLI